MADELESMTDELESMADELKSKANELKSKFRAMNPDAYNLQELEVIEDDESIKKNRQILAEWAKEDEEAKKEKNKKEWQLVLTYAGIGAIIGIIISFF